MFAVTTEHKGDHSIVAVAGEITTDSETELVAAFDALPDTARRVILNFAQTRYANSAGLSVLLSLITRSTEEGRRVDICGLTSHFAKVMGIVGIEEFARVFPTLEDAELEA